MGGGALASEGTKASLQAMIAKATPACQLRFKDISEFPLLLAMPEVREFFLTGKPNSGLRTALEKCSSDLLLKVVLQIEQEYESVCGEMKPLSSLKTELKSAYLSKLKVKTPRYPPADQAKLFRTLLALKGDAEFLAKKIEGIKGAPSVTALSKTLFGQVDEVRKVTVVGAKPPVLTELKLLLSELCKSESPCPFWDATALYKVLVTPDAGIAAYIPEMAQLVISEHLLSAPTRLHRVVLTHELAHVAERRAWIFEREDWKSEFIGFSGWHVGADGAYSLPAPKDPKPRKDILTELSYHSPFSILPDGILEPHAKGKDGFVMAKTYRVTDERDDISEDIADHVAIFQYAPDRYCSEGRAVAPQKYEWVRKRLFPNATALRCPSPSP